MTKKGFLQSNKEIIAGNVYNKYMSTNPIVKRIMKNYFYVLDKFVKELSINNVLDVGCGEGYLSNHIKKLFDVKNNRLSLTGVDLSKDIIKIAKNNYSDILFFVASIYNLPFLMNSFDLVLSCEVLEHIEDPFKVVREIKRVSRKYCLFSVPQEPIWRILNMLRGKYIKDFGNTPGHIQYFNKKQFLEILDDSGLIIEKFEAPFPWLMGLYRKS